MKLPNAHLALVGGDKIAEYLLNPAHPDNGGKAVFFFAMGFQIEDWHVLADALRKLTDKPMSVKTMASPHGMKYIVEGEIETPCGKRPRVRTIWIIDKGFLAPRLVTAYPAQN
jgi:hypothetical protein